MEYGRKPGEMPPIEPLQRWVYLKGISFTPKTSAGLRKARKALKGSKGSSIAWAIAMKIKQKGIKERPFWRPSVKYTEQEATKIKGETFQKLFKPTKVKKHS